MQVMVDGQETSFSEALLEIARQLRSDLVSRQERDDSECKRLGIFPVEPSQQRVSFYQDQQANLASPEALDKELHRS